MCTHSLYIHIAHQSGVPTVAAQIPFFPIAKAFTVGDASVATAVKILDVHWKTNTLSTAAQILADLSMLAQASLKLLESP